MFVLLKNQNGQSQGQSLTCEDKQSTTFWAVRFIRMAIEVCQFLRVSRRAPSFSMIKNVNDRKSFDNDASY
jgi:hypothetical protein